MPDFGSTVLLRTPLGINLSAIRQLFPSIAITSRRNSPRGDDNLQRAEVYLRITEEQLNAIYTASQEANETFAEDIAQIKGELHDINSAFHTVKKARGSQSTLKQTLQRLGNDAATKDILRAARRLSERAKYTSDRVASTDPSPASITLQTASSSEYSAVPDNELTAQADLRGVGFSFNGQPTADDTRKIESVIRLVDKYSDDDDMEQSESVRVLRSRKSELSTYSFHYWGPDAYKTGESSSLPDGTSSQHSVQSRTSSGILLGAHTTFQQCTFNISNMQSNDNCTVSDATANLGVSVTDRGHPNIPPLVVVRGSQGLEAMEAKGIPLQDAAINDIQYISERYSSAVLDSELQDGNSAEATCSETRPNTGNASLMEMENAKSHSMIVSESAMVFSPTMNFNSPGATGATNTSIGARPAHCPPRQSSAQSQSPEGPRVKCMEFSGDSVVYNPTLNDQSQDASGAYNQETHVSTGS